MDPFSFLNHYNHDIQTLFLCSLLVAIICVTIYSRTILCCWSCIFLILSLVSSRAFPYLACHLRKLCCRVSITIVSGCNTRQAIVSACNTWQNSQQRCVCVCVCLVVMMKYTTEKSMIWVEKYYFALNRQEECWEISYLCNFCLCFDVLNVLFLVRACSPFSS